MANKNKNKNRNKGNRPPQERHPGAGSGEKQLSPQEARAKKQKEKQDKKDQFRASQVELAAKDNTVVVKTDTPETSRAVGLLAKNDYYIEKLRTNVVTDSKVNSYSVIFLLEMNKKIREMLNTQNALLCQALGYKSGYTPPWGSDAPQESHEVVIDEMKGLIADHEKMVPGGIKLAKQHQPLQEVKKPVVAAVAPKKTAREKRPHVEGSAAPAEPLAAAAP